MKNRFPLLGARVKEGLVGEPFKFLVHEKSLRETREGEYTYVKSPTSDTVHAYIEDAMNGSRKLSDDMLSSLFVLHREDAPETFHLVFCVAHLVTDGMANANLVRTFLHTLTLPTLPEVPDLPGQLAMAVSSESLSPSLIFSPARQRWRNAAAKIMWEKSRTQMQGGHGLPKHFTSQTPITPARSRRITLSFPVDVSQKILEACRANFVTFGHAFPVIAQAALSRVLHRQYLKGEITEEQWQYRLRQPTHTGGPLNLRPMLNENWLAAGGEGEVNIW